ncbi:MucB/RseB C-terminal domain-containing protein [Variovorax terrae]|uniref:MucB/RseB C-terminal domain-containing protein n=1 Tax=Variovorax terrae TaxID=2923278 RepID=A0A9X2ANE9_9BURK|nr:MucB/RseB C-terminal domain-containing protein [Variovorax terrae]MCJ0764299.1 MucB/RseB C-terminal domain-containing protein [Variovorax terrae]
MKLQPFCRYVLALWAGSAINFVAAQVPAAVPAAPAAPASADSKAAERGVSDWLMRMHEASRKRAYIGTFVVSSSAGSMASARIWHACDGDQQMERVESLTGTQRSIFRRNDEVITFLPGSKVARIEKRESLGLFPNLLQSSESSIPEFYAARKVGYDRVAGFDAEVVQLAPKDNLRFGYRIWSEKKSGLVVKLQTLDTDGRVLEQAAFSELQIDAPVKFDKLAQMMGNTEGYKVERPELVKTTAAAEGWVLKSPVPGFKPMSCYKRPTTGGAVPDSTMQWVFSDGLASVSLFVEAYDRQRHGQEMLLAMGATQTLTRRLSAPAGDKSGDWWLTAVGEVPPQTLKAFAQGLERKKQ